MTEIPVGVPDFETAGVTFRCFAAPDGVNELGIPATRLIWRGVGVPAVVGRNVGMRACWAKANGQIVGQAFPSLKSAMKAAAMAATSAARAA